MSTSTPGRRPPRRDVDGLEAAAPGTHPVQPPRGAGVGHRLHLLARDLDQGSGR